MRYEKFLVWFFFGFILFFKISSSFLCLWFKNAIEIIKLCYKNIFKNDVLIILDSSLFITHLMCSFFFSKSCLLTIELLFTSMLHKHVMKLCISQV
jgi:hypothetical protein